MARKWNDLYSKIDESRRAVIEARVRDLERELPLNEIRRARAFTQVQLAEEMDATQGEVSAIERRTDHYVSTLRRYVAAMGGELDIIARFAEGSIRIQHFQTLDDAVSIEHMEPAGVGPAKAEAVPLEAKRRNLKRDTDKQG